MKILITTCILLICCNCIKANAPPCKAAVKGNIPGWISVSSDGSHFIYTKTGDKFVVWGFNYDHDNFGRLIEDYWDKDWAAVTQDFEAMKKLGANVVRIHIQFSKFMVSPEKPNEANLKQLARLVQLAENTGLYIDVTGLGCYHKEDVPDWYTRMDEAARWDAQANFWRAVSKVCANSPAIFCYDLANEPLVPRPNKENTEWLTGHLGGMYFDQLLTLDLKGRTREQVAEAWVNKLVSAIHENDTRHMITVGVNPVYFGFNGKADDVFASKAVNKNLDYISIHIYPRSGKIDWAIKSIDYYRIPGKPIINEETFVVKCNVMELDTFINRTRNILSGYVGFYWGSKGNNNINKSLAKAFMDQWLKYFHSKAAEMVQPVPKTQ